MYDVAIVGARCAGAPLAMLLARAGHSVLMVDRATFPSDTMSTHFIQSPGMLRLHRWGLLETLLDTGCPPITDALFDTGGELTELPIPLVPPVDGLVSARRFILDKILIDAAVAAGAELAEGVSVDAVLRDGERVTGVRGHTSEGDLEARARFVVGADGRHSIVADKVGAGMVRFDEALSAGYYSYYTGTGIDRTQLFFYDDIAGVMFPTHDDAVCVAVVWERDLFGELKRDIEGHFNAALKRFGEEGQRVLDGERVERFVGTNDIHNYLRQTHGDGWALVGDAVYNKDPIPADGITDSFRGAEMLAGALDKVLTGELSEADALAAYADGYRATADKRLEPAVRTSRFDLSPKQRLEAFIEIRMHDFAELDEMLA
ncbi:MAG TPA: NAD(P)/FAD-dependent oxidoreductase [Actinomycetota bacterium]|nr:NAD(P)/FAD-dependent oxidoreductase [Actinomycetota bacterium]